MLGVWSKYKLQALVYDILPSTTAVFSYAIGSRKLSANEQFFVGAQTVVGLLQTTQIKQGVSFITVTAHVTVLRRKHPSGLSLCLLLASLSDTFLQTLPQLVTPLTGHSFLSTQLSVHRRGQLPQKGVGTNNTVEQHSIEVRK